MEKDLPGELRIEYVPLDAVVSLLWKRNPKRHDLQILVESISKHSFRDAPAFDALLQEGGAIVDGNGRVEALAWMREHGKEPPAGIRVDGEGRWLVPVQFGVDSRSRDAAVAYAIDANSTVMSGGDFDGFDMARLWDSSYVVLLGGLEELPVTVDEEMLAALGSSILDAEPGEVPEGDLGDGDGEKEDSFRHRCPKCGYEWVERGGR